MEVRHEKHGINAELKDFSQAQFEIYQPLAIRASADNFILFGTDKGVTADAVVRGAIVRAAITANFLTGITHEQLGALSPKAVSWLAKKVQAHIKEVVSPEDDPN